MALSPPSVLQWTANSPSNLLFEAPRLDNGLAPAPKRPRRSKVRHYERQKSEKAQLTQQLAELSELLQQEQAKKKLQRDQQPLPLPINSVWRSLARRHLEGRLASEAQRRWLQTAIVGKTELIDDLRQVVRQHLKIAALVAAQSEGEKPALFLEPTDNLLYSLDSQDCDLLYTQTDSVFSACGLDRTSESPEFQRSVTTDSDGVSIQYTSRQRMLFSFEQMCESIWMLAHLLNRQEDREEYTGNEDKENTLAMKFRMTDRLPSGQVASMTQRVVCRRFKEQNRMVFVTKSFLVGEGPCRGMQTDESGWTILRPSASGSGTVMEVCMKQVPLHLNSASAVPRSVVNYYNELLQTLHQENLREATNGAESLLLDDVLAGINV
ncbi:hypothetical protein V7S43_004093 [Phytophthora oleae]|uniref:START domain-containing protein n=1 Tax=Phytophthora oleae TaxID=2107226 RepID=A0ABD3FVG9_9STRA